MKILVFGAGVLGCNLARNFFRAGKDVTLLARGNWAAEIQKNGLRIKDKFLPRISVSRHPGRDRAEAGRRLRRDLCRPALYAARFHFGDAACQPGENHRLCRQQCLRTGACRALPEKNVLFASALSAGHREPDYVTSIDLKKITIGQLLGDRSNEQLIGQIFDGTKYKVVYEPNMEDYLLCHAAFVMPAAFACYKTDGDLKKLKGNTAYLSRLIDANIEGYRAIRNAGHEILPKSDADFAGTAYRKTCLHFFKLMCATSLGKICASDHAMNAVDEMGALNRGLKTFFDAHGADYPVWRELEAESGKYLK